MGLHNFKFLMFINNLLVTGAVPSFFSETYNGYTLIMPLTDYGTRSPLTVNSSFAENWCSNINASLPRITNETEQKVIAGFVRNATGKYKFDGIQTIFVNKINHTVGNWSWVNGQTNKGFSVKAASSSTGNDEFFFGYLRTDDYLIYQSQPGAQRRCICETLKPSNKYGRCDTTLDNKCYWKKDVSSTWYKARSDCLDEGGDLVSFDVVNEMDLTDSLKNLSMNASNGYWVGLSKSVWRWNDKVIGLKHNTDSEIKYSKWNGDRPSDYNAKCLCLDTSSSNKWIGCDCAQKYPFICKRYVISETSTQNLPMDQMANTSVTTETVRLALVLSSCVLIVIIILIVVVYIIRKQKNRPLSSTRYKSFLRETTSNTIEISVYAQVQRSTINESTANCSSSDTAYANVQSFRPLKPDETSEPMTAATANVIPIYAEIEKAIIIQSTANWSASNTEYANVQPVEAYNAEYAELDELQIK